MICSICDNILPHGNSQELNCKKVLLKHFERQLFITKEEIKLLKFDIKDFEESNFS